MIIEGMQDLKKQNSKAALSYEPFCVKFKGIEGGADCFVNSDEIDEEILINIAKRKFLDEGTYISEISFKVAGVILNIGDEIRIKSCLFEIGGARGEIFKIKSVNYTIDQSGVFLNVVALRWD